MKKLYSLKNLYTVLSCIVSLSLQAQNFKLIDVNTTKNSNPSNYQFSTKNQLAEFNGEFYFSAEDGVHGTELYASNGTSEGTRLVKDLYPGTASSYPNNIFVSGSNIYFAALADNTNNEKLWVSDGTEAGTQVIDALPAGTDYGYLQRLTDVSGVLYFLYYYNDANFISYRQLWKSDGTAAGTVFVANLNGQAEQLTNVNGRLFFTFYNYSEASGNELYTSDGTEAGTALVADINPNLYTGSNPAHLTAVGSLLYFSADDGTGIKLWVSDGTFTGTHPVRNKNNIYLASAYTYENDPFTIRDHTLFFQGYATGTGNELCKYNTSDTTFHHVTLVKNIIAGDKNSYPSFITNVNGTLFFTIGPDSADAQLWKTDGTRAGTVLVKNINPGGQNFYYGLTAYNGILLFAYGNNALGSELWKSNGTAEGTVLVKDILPGSRSSYPRYIAVKNDIFIFGADSPKGIELWRSDGTETGTIMVKNINGITTGASSPSDMTPLANGQVIFTANDGRNPGNLFVTDGTTATTKQVKANVYQQYLYTGRQGFINLKNVTYFLGYNWRLWKTDGTKTGTSILPIPAFAQIQSGYVTNMVATGDLLYIFSYDYTNGQTTMWRTDGTAAGTYKLKNDLPYYYYLYPTAVGNTLFFVSTDNITGVSSLWKTDGSSKGTKAVKEIGSNPPANLYSFNGKLYFNAYTPTNSFGPSLWVSDGTEAGTRVVKDVAMVQQPFADANGKLFFYALDRVSNGYELFASDGTSSGTKIVKDINPGGASSNAYLLVSGDTLLYFIADDGKNGGELWKSNGTPAGTKLVRNITDGMAGTVFSNMVTAGDNLFFTINDTLWQSNGRKADTHPVEDVNLAGVSQFRELTAVGDSLYFSGYTYATGIELYAGSAVINATPAVTLSIPNDIITFTAPAKIKLNATATDIDGAISKVEFYKGTTLLHTEYVIPYDYLWVNVPAGNYTLTAKAYDDKGLVATSNSIKVSVVAPETPLISLSSSLNNKTQSGADFSIKLSPNPAGSMINLSTAGWPKNAPLKISIISPSGIVIKTLTSGKANAMIQVDISNFTKGTYTMKIISGNNVQHTSFVKL